MMAASIHGQSGTFRHVAYAPSTNRFPGANVRAEVAVYKSTNGGATYGTTRVATGLLNYDADAAATGCGRYWHTFE